MKRTTKYFFIALIVVGMMLVVANTYVREGFANKPAGMPILTLPVAAKKPAAAAKKI